MITHKSLKRLSPEIGIIVIYLWKCISDFCFVKRFRNYKENTGDAGFFWSFRF
jgi:hypothetical protein